MLKLDLHYTEPRLVSLYDQDNPRGPDTDFYLQLAAKLAARRIIDLGCGTGLLTCELARPERQVIGVDPSAMMLSYARRKPGAEQVRWIEGDASALGTPAADLLIMTGNVAQIFLDDADWEATLAAIGTALRPGGYLAFESRHPAARAWESWVRDRSFEQFDSPYGPMACWLELVAVHGENVRFAGYNQFLATGELLVAESELRFRDQAALTESLRRAGFVVEDVYGDWYHGPVTEQSRTMVFVARYGSVE
ncbi:MAG: class I SAM-dependent methyltransferase [Anaerolineales bacterium]|nr:class I SAM-dependent methyltransferase [Anaerolineales bacterium]